MKMSWVRLFVADLMALTEQFRDEEGKVDYEALGKEELAFRRALATGNFEKSERARIAVEKAAKISQNNTRAVNSRWQEAAAPIGEEAKETQGEGTAARYAVIPSWEEFLSFVDGEGLDYSDAREWWEMSIVDRAGKDRFGNPIGNWKGACKRFCGSKKKGRG